jgi:hypothetical protein
MSTKIAQKRFTEQELKEELKEIKSWRSREPKDSRVIEIARHFASMQQWDLAIEALQLVSNEKDRNLLIADLIEGFLLPANEIALAKKFAKYLTPVLEIESLIWIRIALADNDTEQAQKIAERLPSPLSRNFAYLHIMESYLANKEKYKANELIKLLLENIRTIYDNKSRSYILRELALNLFMPNNEKEQAIEMATLIPDETIRAQVLNKINASK